MKINLMVLRAGLEPAHPKIMDFKSIAATNYAIGALLVLPLRFELRSSPHLEASPGYKSGALPLSYGSKNYSLLPNN